MIRRKYSPQFVNYINNIIEENEEEKTKPLPTIKKLFTIGKWSFLIATNNCKKGVKYKV
jgi:hypothetical protein